MQKSIYPSRRQKALFGSENVDVQKFHIVTSGAIRYFRSTYKTIILIYLLITLVGLFEIFTGVRILSAIQRGQVLSVNHAILITMMSGFLYFLHNQILLVLGHGYKSRDAQLHVDRLTLKDECASSLSIISSMHLISILLAGAVIWALLGMIGTPLYNPAIADQLPAFTALLEKFVSGDFFKAMEAGDVAMKFKPFVWFVGLSMSLIIFLSSLGLIQTTLARMRF